MDTIWEGDIAYQYNPHTGEFEPVTDSEFYAQQGACPGCGDHHTGECTP